MNSIMETVCGVCSNVRKGTQQGVSFQKLLGLIRKEFKKNDIFLVVKTTRDKTLNENVFYANGYYDPDYDKHHECPIEIIIAHNFSKDRVWFPADTTHLLYHIFDSVVHELRHQRQYRKRKFKPGVSKGDSHAEYLADPDEIDAYSISIATELCRSLGRVRALRYLHNVEKLSRFKLNGVFVSPCLGMYVGAHPNPNSRVIREISKKVYVRLQKIDTDCIFV